MTTASPAAFPLSPDSRIGDIVAARPALARFFEKLGIDYCCGGKQTLAAASASRNLAPATVVTLLEAAASALDAPPTDVNPTSLSLTELATHIEETHHAYLKTALPRLVTLARKVADKHGERDPRLLEVTNLVNDLAGDMLLHMQKEERILFPLVRHIDAGEDDVSAAMLAGPIAQMEVEHSVAGDQTVRLRQLTDEFTPSAAACNSHRALLDGLAAFEADLHSHVHKENNVLFPRALALAASRVA